MNRPVDNSCFGQTHQASQLAHEQDAIRAETLPFAVGAADVCKNTPVLAP
jgi:hypothetical protein